MEVFTPSLWLQRQQTQCPCLAVSHVGHQVTLSYPLISHLVTWDTRTERQPQGGDLFKLQSETEPLMSNLEWSCKVSEHSKQTAERTIAEFGSLWIALTSLVLQGVCSITPLVLHTLNAVVRMNSDSQLKNITHNPSKRWPTTAVAQYRKKICEKGCRDTVYTKLKQRLHT